MELEHAILSGMKKVASIIVSNETYDSILGDRLLTADYQALHVDESGQLDQPEIVVEHFCKRIEKARPSFYRLNEIEREADVIAFASTANNRRELSFLENVLHREGFDTRIANLADARRERSSSVRTDVTAALQTSFRRMIDSGVPFTRSLLHQLIAYASFTQGAFLSLSQSSARVLVVANDHSPGPVAYTKIAEYLGMESVYLQHAEVTNNFPPLDFSLSILRNIASKDTYRSLGVTEGDVLVLPRELGTLDTGSIIERRRSLFGRRRLPVVIYPSGVSSMDVLQHLHQSLLTNPEVSTVSVKLHPAEKNEVAYHERGLHTIREIPREAHVAICGNSSVVIELIGLGNLVYQCFDLDDIPSDYYGFVAAGFASELPVDRVARRFVQLAHTELDLDEFARFDPRVEDARNHAEAVRAHRLLRMVFSRKNRTPEEIAGLHLRESLLRDLYCFPALAIRRSRDQPEAYGTDSWLVRILDNAFAERDVKVVGTFSSVEVREPKSVLEFWLVSKAIDWNGRTPTAENVAQLAAFATSYVGDRHVRAWLEAKCFDIITRHGEPRELLAFLLRCEIVRPESLSSNRKVSIDRYIRRSVDTRDELEAAFTEAFRRCSRLERLKISVQNKHDIDGNLEYMDYQVVEEEFLEAQPTLAGEYREFVQKPYRGLRGRTQFMDVERNALQHEAILSTIEHHLQTQTGYAFIRLSDGEGIIFKGPSSAFTQADSINRQRHWWGREIDGFVLNRLLEELRLSVYEADLLGIPSVYRFLRDHSDRSKSLLQNIQGRGLVSVLSGIASLDTPAKRYTDDKANLSLFTESATFERLAKSAKKFVVITSGTTAAVRGAFTMSMNCVHIPVPTHYKTTGNPKYLTSDRPLPYVYGDVNAMIESVVEPGDLVLVGAGVAGKVFVRTAKRRNATALDIGSAMDQLLEAGIHSLF